MFQYALYLSLREKGFESKIDITQLKQYKLHNGWELDSIFEISPSIATYKEVKQYSWNRKNDYICRFNRHFLPAKRTEYLEKNYSVFAENIFKDDNIKYIQGYWHNEKYFRDIRDQIIETYSFKTPTGKNLETLNIISQTNSVSVHIRRGDYINHSYLGNVCSNEYYLKAISTMTKLINNPIFFFFSDDIAYCKSNFKIPNAHFINWNMGNESYWDMFLMSSCKHNIIANSSFSWWGAWLNKNPKKKVIGPSIWNKRDKYFDVLPNSWMKI